jgi:hypothetical protein
MSAQVNYFELEGVKYPIRFGINAIRLFCKGRGIELAEFSTMFSGMSSDSFRISDMDNLGELTICAIQDGIRKTKTTDLPIPTIDDIIDVFEDEKAVTSLLGHLIDGMPDSASEASATPGDDEKNASRLNP